MSFVLGYGLIPSLIAAVALTATSVGVSLGLWEKHKALKTRNGALLTDVAEMDDLSGVAFMALLFAVIPVLRGSGEGGGLWSELLASGGIFLVKFLAFAGACVFIGRYLERRVTTTFGRFGSPPELMVLVTGIGILIAGVAEWLGMSAAIGALFAGIIFSRDPEAVNIEAGFRGIFHLLAPFFFVGIGLQFELSALGSAIAAGSALVAVAILGKLVGTGFPALVATGAAGATLIAVSMVPRAEITLIIMSRGRELGDWAVPAELYAAFVLVSAVTCVVAPVALEVLFRRWPQEASGEEDAGSGP
jgi:Kef-type K+ transport system membrane component KefB